MPEPASTPEVSCPGCGRAYVADRFPSGRSLRCTCGARVGRELRTGVLALEDEPRFLADVMLARLAHWLRALGYDTDWEAEIEDAELVRRALEQRRVLLTRDRRLAAEWWVEGILLIQSDRPLDQLREVAAALRLSPERMFTRCTRCNLPLEPAPDAEVRDRVPPDVLRHQHEFSTCRACRRVYWQGGHTERMRRALEAALEAPTG